MPRQLVVCLDGTGNCFSATPTNILRIVRSLERDPEQVLSYYDQGVGTFGLRETLFVWQKLPSRWFGLAFGWGMARTVASAYEFLAHNYRPDDEIYLFGFSRGAYTARSLAALIHACGLVQPHQLNLFEFAWAMLKARVKPTGPKRQRMPNFALQGQFKNAFGRAIPIKFMGLFDTVKSVGWVYDPTVIPWTARNPSVVTVRHALSIDERRAFFHPQPWTDDPKLKTQVQQVWFAGVHSDVGGGYDPKEAQLAGVALCWMLGEAIADGLKINADRVQVEMRPPHGTAPNLRGDLHDSMLPAWKAAEWVPTYDFDYSDKQRHLRVGAMPPFGKPRPRVIPEGAVLHESVVERLRERADYRPPNLPAQYTVVRNDANAPVFGGTAKVSGTEIVTYSADLQAQ